MSIWLVIFNACVLGSLLLGGYCISLALSRPKPLSLSISVPEPLPAMAPLPAAEPPQAPPDLFSDDEAVTTVKRLVTRSRIDRPMVDPFAVTTVARRYVPRTPRHLHEAMTVVCPVVAYRAQRRISSAAYQRPMGTW